MSSMNSSDDTTQVIYNFIKQHIKEQGFPPSFREIAVACHVGRSSVIRHLDRLEKWGWISRQMGKSRSIMLATNLQSN